MAVGILITLPALSACRWDRVVHAAPFWIRTNCQRGPGPQEAHPCLYFGAVSGPTPVISQWVVCGRPTRAERPLGSPIVPVSRHRRRRSVSFALGERTRLHPPPR